MEALADMDAVPSWSSVHKRVEVVDKHPDGRPHHVRVTIAVTGIHDTELLEYHWGPDWMVWDAGKTPQQHGQHGEYNLTPRATTRPGCASPSRSNRRRRCRSSGSTGPARKSCAAALEGLRERVMGVRPGWVAGRSLQRGQPPDRLVEGVVAFAESEAHQVIPPWLLRGVRGGRIAECRQRMAATPTFSGSAAQNAVLSS